MNGWLIFALIMGILTLLACLKLGIHVIYSDNYLWFRLLIGKFRIKLAGSDKEPSVRKSAGRRTKVSAAKKESKKRWVKAALAHWSDILALIGKVLTAPTIEIMRLKIMVGNEDPEACAITYGRVCGLAAGLLPLLENTFTVKKRDVQIYCCFDRSNIQIDAEAVVVLRVYQIIGLAIASIGLILSIYRNVDNTNKKVVENV